MSFFKVSKIIASHSASYSPTPKGPGGTYSKVGVKFQILPPRAPGTFGTQTPVKVIDAQGSYTVISVPSTWQWNDPDVEFDLPLNASFDVEVWCEGVVASSKRVYGTQLSYLALGQTITLSWKLHTPASTGTLTGDLTIHIVRNNTPVASTASSSVTPKAPLPSSSSTGSLSTPKFNLTKSHKVLNATPLPSAVGSTTSGLSPSVSQLGLSVSTATSSSSSSSSSTVESTKPDNDESKSSTVVSNTHRISAKAATVASAWNVKLPEPLEMSLASSKTVGSAVSKDGSAKKLQYEMLPIGLSKTRFLRVACSMFGAIAIAEDGSLHYWTLDSDGLIYTEGGPVPKLEGVTVVDIAAGHDHYLAVTVDGDLFAWGSNQFFQCTPEPVTRVYTPTKVSTKHVLACSAGGHSSLVIDAEGVAFTWGKAEISVTIPVAPATASSTPSSTEHQERPRTKPTHQTIIVDSLGHGEAQTSFRGSSLYVREPTMVALPEQAQFLQASMSSTMTILVSREGKVYAWGDANAIAASTPDAFSSTPVPIPFPKGVRIVRALAGDYHALALDASGHLWTWGGRFIGGSADPALTNSEPRRITFGKSDDVVVDFGMSQDISSALTSSSELWTWDHPSASPLRADSVSGETAVGVSHGTSSHTLFVLFGSQQASSRSASTSDLPRSQSTIYDSSNDFDISLDEDEANSLLDTLTDEFVTPQ